MYLLFLVLRFLPIVHVVDSVENLERTIRELEESAEIAAEMEEVQAEELKMVLRDLEGRDALVRNLEEAIRMSVISYLFAYLFIRAPQLFSGSYHSNEISLSSMTL